jgi:hypothetical protein
VAILSRESVIRQGRAFQEASFTETVKVGPLVEVENPETLEMVKSVQADLVGPALVKYPTLTVSERDIPGSQVAIGDVVVKRPVSAPVSPVGHWFEVIASSIDPSLVGRRYSIKSAPQAGQTTSHRYPVREDN